MPLDLKKPILYLITGGKATEASTPDSREFQDILELVSAAVHAGIQLVQLREKELSARALFELTSRAARIANGSSTRILVNDRADIAAAAGADGVHLTTRSLEPEIVRAAFGEEFLVGVSTHSPAEAESARRGGADFAVLGPIFETPSKLSYGRPLGVATLKEIAGPLNPFPLLALGGISETNAADCLHAGAAGVAGISLFADGGRIKNVVKSILSAHAD